jgi:hydrogenase expression/formation protein HypD
MLRVPGSTHSLLEAKSKGADVRILYSPLEAVKLAKDNPDKQVVFFAVGFETTAPANALSVIHAYREGLQNYSILASHVLVPPAINAVMEDDLVKIQGLLAAGHVCTIMGTGEYGSLVEKLKVPIVVTGFEPVDILQGILMVVKQLEKEDFKLENQYARVVRPEGNPEAIKVIEDVFEITDREWRGVGNIPSSGYQVKDKYAAFDANKKFNIDIPETKENPDCIAGQVLKGIKKPHECPQFGTGCTPERPLGAPMVSSEGACAAYYHFSKISEQLIQA